MLVRWSGAILVLLAAAAAEAQITSVASFNALSTPAQRHVVRLEPGGGYPATYLAAIQREAVDNVHPGLSFYRSIDEGATWSFYDAINPSNYATLGPAASQRDTADLVKVGNDVALVYSYDGPSLVPDAKLDPLHKVYFQWWRYNGAGGWTSQAPVLVFSPAVGQVYHRGEIAIDSAGRIWVQAWLRSGPACTSVECARCYLPDGDNYPTTLTMAVSTDGGARFQRQPDLATTVCRAGGRLSSLGTRMMMLWNGYSANQNGTAVGTKFIVRNDSDPLSSWAPQRQAFTDDNLDGIYHGAALSAVADGGGGLHLVYKDHSQQHLYYRSFNGTSFSPKQLLDASTDDWILQPAITVFNHDLYVFVNHLVGSETTPRPPGFDSSNYEMRLFRKSAGWEAYRVVDSVHALKAYPGSPESLSASASRVPCIFGEKAAASPATDERVAFSPPAAVTDFALTANAQGVTTVHGSSSTLVLTVTPSGFSGKVTLSASGVPPGAGVVISPSTVSIGPGSATSTVTLSAGSGAVGTYALTFTGTGSGLTRTTTVSWTIVPVAGVPRVSTLRDSFSGPALDPGLWKSSITGGSAGATGGTLTLTPSAFTAAAGIFVTSAGRYGLTGSSLVAQVAGVVDHRGGINNKLVLTDGVDQLGFWYEAGYLYAFAVKNGAQTGFAKVPYSAIDHAWWKIEETAGTVTWQTSPDGRTWTQQGVAAAATLGVSLEAVAVQFNVKAYGGGALAAGPALYRNLNSAPQGPPKVSTLRDSFSNGIDATRWSTSLVAGTANATGGVLSLTPETGRSGAGLFVTSKDAYSLIGSQATVQVAATVDSAGRINNKFVLVLDGSNELGWWYERGMLFGYVISNGIEFDPVVISYQASAHAYWRLRHSGGLLLWETSADGASFVEQGRTATSNIPFIAQPMKVQFNVKAWGTGATTPLPARYTNLNQ